MEYAKYERENMTGDRCASPFQSTGGVDPEGYVGTKNNNAFLLTDRLTAGPFILHVKEVSYWALTLVYIKLNSEENTSYSIYFKTNNKE